jgi:hypothetical protein
MSNPGIGPLFLGGCAAHAFFGRFVEGWMKTGTGSAMSCTVAESEPQSIAVPVPVFISPRPTSVSTARMQGIYNLSLRDDSADLTSYGISDPRAA